MKYDLGTKADVLELNKKYNIKFSKKLGQNFLIDKNIINKIISSMDIKNKSIIEIGPGLGALTYQLVEEAKDVLSIEIDSYLVNALTDIFYEYKNLYIINQDVLKVNLKEETKKLSNNKYSVIGNLPYYITTPIIMNLLESELNLDEMVFMVQKEVAERMVAKPKSKDYGILTLILEYFCETEILFLVSENSFIPKPAVKSAVVKIKKKKEIEENIKKSYIRIVKAAFNQRRKTILNSLGSIIKREELIEIFKEINLDPKLRAEALTMYDYIRLAKNIERKNLF